MRRLCLRAAFSREKTRSKPLVRAYIATFQLIDTGFGFNSHCHAVTTEGQVVSVQIPILLGA